MGYSHQHLHDAFVKRAPDVITQDGTVMSVVYITAQPTFTGVIGGFTTITSQDFSSTDPSEIATDSGQTTASPTVASSSSSSSSSSVLAVTNPDPNFTSTAAATSGQDTSSSVAGAFATASSSSTSSPSSSTSTSAGLSTGAKAGIAIGVLALIAVVAAVLLCIIGKKKKQRDEAARTDNEKNHGGVRVPIIQEDDFGVEKANAAAPRLSLRPMSRMMPDFSGGNNRSRLSNGNMLNTIGESGQQNNRHLTPSPQPRAISPAPQSMQSPNPNNPFNDPQNPFTDPKNVVAMERKPAPMPAPSLSPVSPITPPTPVALAPAPGPAPASTPMPMSMPSAAPAPAPTSALPAAPIAAAAAAPGAAALAMGLTAGSSPVSQKAVETMEPAQAPFAGPGPAPAPVIPAGPGPESPQGNVYRVLMDFVPSMEDELELRSGQLVRMLHEYDDGWALCIRLDRSQQGVVPRTCLAAKPSKPKPSHLNQYARAQSPQSMRSGPNIHSGRNSPAMNRPMSPAGGPGRMNGPGSAMNSPRFAPPRPGMAPGSRSMSPAPRPMSPGAFNQAPRPLSPGPRPSPSRSMSPGPYASGQRPPPMGAEQRRRSNSASGAMNLRDRNNGPVGPSKLGPGNPGFRSQSPGVAF